MRVGLFGGSFDPIHRGHVDPVQEARRALGLERVIYLPTALPPHKPGRGHASPWARYAMVELALLGEKGLFASPFELTLDRPAYTVDTVEHFRRELPGAELYLLVGSDSFVELPQWFRWRDIAAAARLVVLARPGWDLEEESTLAAELAELLRGGRVQLLRQRQVSASSTLLRKLLARGEPLPPGWLPNLVLDFIRKYDLYR